MNARIQQALREKFVASAEKAMESEMDRLPAYRQDDCFRHLGWPEFRKACAAVMLRQAEYASLRSWGLADSSLNACMAHLYGSDWRCEIPMRDTAQSAQGAK